MSDQDEPKDTGRDSDEDRDSDAGEESEREPVPAPKKAETKATAATKRREPAAVAPKSAPLSSSSVGLFVTLALAAGGAAGWFGHIQQAKAALKAESAAAPAGSGAPAGPCGAWEAKICSGTGGDKSATCQQAKGAVELLTPSTCEVALAAVPATLAKLKAARSSCDKLVAKLCADLPPGSQTCDMVKERTPSFPTQRCEEMMKHYDEVIGQLKQVDQQGGMQGGPGGPGGPGAPGPVSSPH